MHSILRCLTAHRAYPLGERITIGRAPTADVQLVSDAVSRLHAVVERQQDGSHVITDLDSRTGTRINGSAVRRAVLQLGTVIEICEFRLRYELVDHLGNPAVPPKLTGFPTLRPTARDQRAAGDTKAIGDGDTDIIADERLLAVPQDHDWLSVLRDVVAFRGLPPGQRRDAPRARFLAARFDEALASSGGISRRASRRHPIGTPVLVGLLRGTDVATRIGDMIDVSANGAQLRTDEPLPIGGLCWILVATGDSEYSGISFTARVVWRQPHDRRVGVSFVGVPIAGPNVLTSVRRE
jgi:hypothetical protein